MSYAFCPHCWREADKGRMSCPACGWDLSSEDPASYKEKLIRALGHPIRDYRMMAIRILGRRKSQSALSAFARLIAGDADTLTLRAITEALQAIGTGEARELLDQLARHPSPFVRDAVQGTASHEQRS